MSLRTKDPAAVLDFSADWSDWLGAGEVISASEWHVEPEEPGGLTVVSETASGSLNTANVEGGILGRSYRLSNRITTSAARIDERSFVIRITEA